MMDLEVSTSTALRGGLDVGGALRDAVSGRLTRFLGRFGDRIRWVDVRFTDVNGPRGGVDTRCRIEAHIEPLGTVIGQATHETALQAVRAAVDKVTTSATRRIERLERRRRSLAVG
jgi:ribosome-associated translation inhibitor RaiA